MADRSNPGMPRVAGRDEYVARQERAATAAAARGLAGLLVISRGAGSYDRAGDLVYLANYYPPFPFVQNQLPKWSGRGHGILVLPADGGPTLCVDTPYHRPDLAMIEDVRMDTHLLKLVVDVLKEKRMDDKRVGLVGTDVLPLSWYRWLRAELPSLTLEDADEVLESMRRIKSPSEQEQVRRACDAGIATLDAMLLAVRPGAAEGDAVAAALGVLARQGATLVDMYVTSGPFSLTYAHARMPGWDPGRVLQRGDLFHVDVFGSLEGYYFDIGRTTTVGAQPTTDQRRVIAAARDSVNAAIAFIKPGVTASDVANAGYAALEQSGVLGDVAHGGRSSGFAAFGHGMGVGWEGPWLAGDDDTPIEAGMYLAVEKTVGVPGVGGATWEENLLVHPVGVEVLTTGGRPWFS